MLRRGIEYDLLPLELPPQRPGLFGERVEAPGARLERRDGGVRLRHPALDLGHGVRQAAGVAADRLDRRLHVLHRRELAAQGRHRFRDVAEPGFRAALRLEHAADLAVGHPQALQRILYRRVSPLETREVVQRGVDSRLRLLESRQALGHLLDRLREPLGIGAHGTDALALGFELRDGIGDAREARLEPTRLRPDVPDGAGRFVQRAAARFYVRERSAQLPDALPDRVEPLVLDLETLDRSLDPVPQRVQPSLESLIGLR